VLFSERYDFKPVKDVFQLDCMDEDLRNGLWNALLSSCLERLFPRGSIFEINVLEDFLEPWAASFAQALWRDFLKKPMDELSLRRSQVFMDIKALYSELEWFRVYDFLEFVVENDHGLDRDTFIQDCNNMLQRELSGWRFIGKQIGPITNEVEIASIEEALDRTTPIAGANAHLSRGLELLSDRNEPDYRNSIKESISAVEAVAQLITGDPKAKFGAALDKLAEKIELHSALKQGLKKIYGYLSNAAGIRHGSTEKSNVTLDDAKFALVYCSAFVNYLIAKSEEAGIDLAPDN